MVEKLIISTPVIDLARYRAGRASCASSMSGPLCRHCGAPLIEGENEDECSSAFNYTARAPRRFYAE
jgi:hypothetical protein